MTDYARVLWLGGGISYEALDLIATVVQAEADEHEQTPLKTELMNVANAARAEITKRPPQRCDLI